MYEQVFYDRDFLIENQQGELVYERDFFKVIVFYDRDFLIENQQGELVYERDFQFVSHTVQI